MAGRKKKGNRSRTKRGTRMPHKWEKKLLIMGGETFLEDERKKPVHRGKEHPPTMGGAGVSLRESQEKNGRGVGTLNG